MRKTESPVSRGLLALAASARSARTGGLTFMLVVVTLVGSVLVPTRESWRIMYLLRETTNVIEPARVAGARLELGLTVESAALEGYRLSGDSVQLARYLAAANEDDRQLAKIDVLTQKLDAGAIDRATAVRRGLDEWRDINRALVDRPSDRAALQLSTQRASYERALGAATALASYLAAEGNARRELVHRSERLGLLANASLVLVALAGVIGVNALRHRERQLSRILERRADEESALRRVARALGGAATSDDVMRQLVEGATATTGASGAYVEWLARGEADDATVLFVRHVAGRPLAPCRRRPRSESLTEAIRGHATAGSLTDIDSVGAWVPSDSSESDTALAGLIAPLFSPNGMFGVLVLLRDRTAPICDEDLRRQIHALADLAAAAFQRVTVQLAERQALDDAQRRAHQEEALRKAAEALAAAFTIDDVTRQIAEHALHAIGAQSAFVEQIAPGAGDRPGSVIVRGTAGTGVPALGATVPLSGSITEAVVARDECAIVADVRRDARWCTASPVAETDSSLIVVPLGHSEAPIGALFVVGTGRPRLGADELARARTFGHLATLAYEKVRLLDEACNGRTELERVMKSRSRLMRGFSHDVKNPLGAADGYAELLTTGIYGALSSEQRERVECIRRSIRVALSLIDDLHQLARAEVGRLELSVTPVDLGDLARKAREDYAASATASGLSLSVQQPSEPLVVATDRARVQQIVGNLLTNAIKYTPRGSIVLRVRRWPSNQLSPSDSWAAIDVTDSGPGIPPEKWDTIFEEFTRLASDETRGAGLGLAISQRLARALGGQITVQSELGSGSTFTIWLPLANTAGPAPTPKTRDTLDRLRDHALVSSIETSVTASSPAPQIG